jgi:hypothetical protein
MFCKKEEKWTELPYTQLFFFLRDHPKVAEQIQARYPDHGDPLQKVPKLPSGIRTRKPSNVQGPPITSKGASPVTEIKSPEELQGICPTQKRLVDAPSVPPLPPYPAISHPGHHPTGLYPLQLIPGGDKAHIPF